MNDREKMLADLGEAWYEAVRVGNLEAAKQFVVQHHDAIGDLLTEPTLEEVLAELEQYGLATLVTISVPDGAPGTYVCRVYSHRDKDGMFPIESGFAHSRIEAASECLRRVKE